MRITYKCKKCRNHLELNPNLDKVNNELRMIIINALIQLNENDFCYNCCNMEEKS